MSCHVFTYGSLMFPEVWQRVVRGGYRSAPARLDGHVRFEIAGETYPGMIVRRGAAVDGVLYFDVSPADMAALDAFEGSEYRRDTVKVALASGEQVDAGTYIYLLPQKLSESSWLPEAFQMERFIDSYCRAKLGSR
ncbi:gamma-glutamylcyclotransferase family protein [Noviherbaspirillum sp.]|uniref:gamma-glutamylcyclotransferase family protein n=1 Tax=Noviherbaspirillum sp. TaxID=1926288 RepID=UPI002D71AA01|nr:gamma-glutamylcyclotransferase family protein [Noviherbaspirillum sp.]HZW22072.1 gamma-glutamylcyclotransferase family protein [Noviherbaspirillum sp.]